MWQEGLGLRVHTHSCVDPALTVDLGKSARKLSLQILSSKLGVIIPALQGFSFFQEEIRHCMGKRSGVGRDAPRMLVSTFCQFISAGCDGWQRRSAGVSRAGANALTPCEI